MDNAATLGRKPHAGGLCPAGRSMLESRLSSPLQVQRDGTVGEVLAASSPTIFLRFRHIIEVMVQCLFGKRAVRLWW